MPFRFQNASGVFQQVMDVLLTKYKWQSALIYLGDIVLLLRTPDEHIDHVWLVLT